MKHIDVSDLQSVRAQLRDPAYVQQLARHLEECAQCAKKAGDLFAGDARAMRGALDRPMEDFHPEDDLAGYVDGTLDAERRAAVARHCAVCETCRAEIEDLEVFAEAIRPRFFRRRAPVWIGIAAALIVAFFLLPIRTSKHAGVQTPTIRVPPRAPAKPIEEPTRRDVPRVQEAQRKPEWQALVDEAVRTGRLPFDEEMRRLGTDESYRGTPETAGPSVHPAGTAIVEPQPTFEWPATAGAESAVVVRSDGRVVVESGKLRDHRWRSSVVLHRGGLYQWEVRVEKDGQSTVLPAPPTPPAFFRVLSEREMATLRDARRTRPDDELLLALLYARAGVVDETRRLLSEYAKTGDRQLARRLMADLP